MGASKPFSPPCATSHGTNFKAISPAAAHLAQNLTRAAAPAPKRTARNLSPSEFVGHLREEFGILVSLRWVHLRCRAGQISTITVPHYGRRLIPASEAARFAASITATTEARA